MMKTKTVIIIAIAALVLGFLLGRLSTSNKSSVEVKEVVKYVPSSYIVRDTISKDRLVPYETVIRDTVVRYLSQSVDTAEILKDYFLSRKYNLDFSNDSIGTFIVDAEVNQNRLVSANSFIQPMVKTVYQEHTNTIYKVPTIQFYGMIGTSLNLDVNKVSLGIDLKQKYMIGVSGIRYNDNYNYTIDFGLKW